MKKRWIRKITGVGLAIVLFAGGLATYAEDFAVTAFSEGERLTELLPLRLVAESSGYTVDWSDDQIITIQGDNHTVKVRINDETVMIDGDTSELQYTPVLIGDKTYISTDFFNCILTGKYITLRADNTYAFADKPAVFSENMMKTVKEISQYPRSVVDATHEDAMQYVISKFNEFGYETEIQEFSYDRLDWSTMELTETNGTNIIAVKKPDLTPTGDVLIVGAHYDGETGVPAANDNGSGLSVMLELARALQGLPSDTEIRFVAFDAEEDGLYGSRNYITTLADSENVVGMLNFDMLAGAKKERVSVSTITGAENYLFNLLKTSVDFQKLELSRGTFGTSDYEPFTLKAIPVVDFSHDAIEDEYHSENDIAENMSEDMLQYAADAGLYIATSMMSNLTPSYRETARPQADDTVVDLSPERYIPVSGSMGAVSRALGAQLIQIASDDSSLKYMANVRLFHFETPFALVYDGWSGTNAVGNPKIEVHQSNVTFAEMKQALDDFIGNATEIRTSQENCQAFAYDSPYGNRFTLHFDSTPDHQEVILSIGSVYDANTESYKIEQGELIRMDSPDLTVEYEISKKNGEIEVLQKAAAPSKELEISEQAQACWDRIKPLLLEEEMNDMEYLVLESDGFGISMPLRLTSDKAQTGVSLSGGKDVEIPDEYKTLSTYIQSCIQNAIVSWEEGESATYRESRPANILYVDYRDLLDDRGSAFDDEGLVKAVAGLKAKALYQEHIMDAEYPASGTLFEKNTYDMDGFVYDFADAFYRDIYSTQWYYEEDLFSKYPNTFVCEEAAESIDYDIICSFAEFVVQDKPAGDSVAEQKIAFFYDYPELFAIRERLRRHMS